MYFKYYVNNCMSTIMIDKNNFNDKENTVGKFSFSAHLTNEYLLEQNCLPQERSLGALVSVW